MRCSVCSDENLATWVNCWMYGGYRLGENGWEPVGTKAELRVTTICDADRAQFVNFALPSAVFGSWLRAWVAPLYGLPFVVGSEQHVQLEIALRGGRTFP